MTREEIEQAAPEWLNDQIAKCFSYDYPIAWSDYIQHAFELEEKIKEMGLIGKYVDAMMGLPEIETFWYDGPIPSEQGTFQLIHATPEQRCSKVKSLANMINRVLTKDYTDYILTI